MVRTQRSIALCGAALIVGLSIVGAGCGGSSMSHTMSPAQAQAVEQQIGSAVAVAVQSAAGGLPTANADRHSLAPAMKDLQQATSTDCTGTPTSETCNIPVSSSAPCPGGGTIAVSGNFDFTLNNGSGSDSTTLTITPTNCSVDNVTINGNPNVMLATTLNFQNNTIQFPVTLMENGGITFGPNPSGSCSINVTATVNSLTSCTISGTVCGQSVSGNC
jgi:hypothetical protein